MSEKEMSAACSGDCDSCGSDCESREMTGGSTVTLQLDNGESVECAILTIFEVEEKQYIVLLPLGEDGMADGEEVFIYRYSVTENGSACLENIVDDEEYAKVSGGFEEYLQQVQSELQLSELEDVIENTSAN